MKRYIALLFLLWCVIPDFSHAVIIENGDTITPAADVTVTGSATLVAAANGSRTALSCTNTSSSVNVRWGSSAVTATTGQQLPSAKSIEIKSLGAVYMISEGANVTVSCTEEAQ